MSAPEDLILGWHAVLAALKQRPDRVEAVWFAAERRASGASRDLMELARTAHVKFHRVPRAKLDKLAAGARHQGIVARVKAEMVRGDKELAEFLANLPEKPLLLVLDGVQDPHNLGACLRSADAAGAHAVVIPRDGAVSVTAAARKVAAGAAETLPVFRVTNLTRALKQLKESGVWLVGASPDADEDLFSADLRGPLALVLGGEGKGLRRLTREACDRLVRIPMAGAVESLNVSVAAGVCLFEAVRQHQRSGRLRLG